MIPVVLPEKMIDLAPISQYFSGYKPKKQVANHAASEPSDSATPSAENEASPEETKSPNEDDNYANVRSPLMNPTMPPEIRLRGTADDGNSALSQNVDQHTNGSSPQSELKINQRRNQGLGQSS